MSFIASLARRSSTTTIPGPRTFCASDDSTRIIGEQMGVAAELLDVLEAAAQLHDVGKIGIPDAILLKPGKLDADEYAFMQKHCGFGKEGRRTPSGPRRGSRSPPRRGGRGNPRHRTFAHSGDGQAASLTHHERWDGGGYPLGLSGEDIPLEGRITAVADVFDALSSKRCYKPAFPLTKCLEILEEGRATHFDPAVLDAFFARRADIVQAQIALADTE